MHLHKLCLPCTLGQHKPPCTWHIHILAKHVDGQYMHGQPCCGSQPCSENAERVKGVYSRNIKWHTYLSSLRVCQKLQPQEMFLLNCHLIKLWVGDAEIEP